MRRWSLLIVGVLLAVALPPSSATPWNLAWQQDVGPGYLTTTPVVDESRVYVRTSGFWTGVERPEVLAFSHEGEQIWSYTNNNTMQHDMSPLVRLQAGEGPCGAWPELLLVGWTNGELMAFHPSNGTLYWTATTTPVSRGITGAPLVESDKVTVATGNGLARFCLADGEMDFEVELSIGWRNGVSATHHGYWVGSEDNRLWRVSHNGTVVDSWNVSGSIRHAPVVVDDRLLLHVQEATSSVLVVYNITSATFQTLAQLGPSPAVPLRVGENVVFGDSAGLTTVRCDSACRVVDALPTKVNGEMSLVSSSGFMAPVNTPQGGWLMVRLNETGSFENHTQFSTPHDGYGTSAAGRTATHLFLGNDAGVLMAYRTNTSQIDVPDPLSGPEDEANHLAVIGTLGLTTGLAVVAWFGKNGRVRDAWRVLTLCTVVLGVLMLPDLSTSWNNALTNESSNSSQTDWNSSWPESWVGTQVVVFEFSESDVVVGGLGAHSDVWSLTQEAAAKSGLLLESTDTSLGVYLTTINGTSNSGWEYFINGERGTVSVDRALIDDTVVLRWRLV